MSMIEDIKTALRFDKELDELYRDYTMLPGTEGEKMQALRVLHGQAQAQADKLRAEIAAIQAKLKNVDRFVNHTKAVAERQLRSLRLHHVGPTDVPESYKMQLGDGHVVTLRVRKSEACIVDPSVIDTLPDDMVKVTKVPKLNLVKASLELGVLFPGAEGCRIETRYHEQLEDFE